MTKLNKIVLVLFLGGLILVTILYGLFDLWLALTQESGSTISWSMVLFGYSNPFLVFLLGHLTGGLLWGLASHFWLGLPSPQEWNEIVQLRADNAALKAKLASLQATHPQDS